MTPDAFVRRWSGATLSERAAAQSHFLDLCALLGEQTPAEADPRGEWYCFERGATKTTGGKGWADVWKRNHFGGEYKGKRRDLDAAYAQLQQYAPALETPPLLIVSDMETAILRPKWTNSVSRPIILRIEELRDANRRAVLKHGCTKPDALRPEKTRQALTEEVAAEFAELARRLRARGHGAEEVAHFVNRLVFCLFAEGAALLPDGLFARMLDAAAKQPARFRDFAERLFGAMRSPGGEVDFTPIAWFNGGLFDGAGALPLEANDIAILRRAAGMDWSEVDPSVLGTLFSASR